MVPKIDEPGAFLQFNFDCEKGVVRPAVASRHLAASLDPNFKKYLCLYHPLLI